MLKRECRKRNPPTLLVGRYIAAATMENSMKRPLKTRVNILSSDPAYGHIYIEKTAIQKDTQTPNIHSSTIYSSQDVKASVHE